MIDFSPLAETGQLASLPGALERARQNQCEGLLGQYRLQQFGHLSAILRERNIGDAGVLPAQTPFRLAMPDEINLLRSALDSPRLCNAFGRLFKRQRETNQRARLHHISRLLDERRVLPRPKIVR